MTLTFVIPTWNRAVSLEKCVRSITSQVTADDPVRVHLIDNASGDATQAICQQLADEFPYLTFRRREKHGDYSESFRDAFRAAPESEWVWTLGDDDMIRSGGLKFVLERLQHLETAENKPDFIHFAEAKRSSGTNNVYFSHRMLDLCNTFGWTEATGFISCNLTRGHLLAAAADSPLWRTYAKSAFVHSCALLEVLRDRPAALYDIPVVTTQDDGQTEDTGRRWAADNISLRYLFIVDALEAMFDAGILTEKLETRFFRYLNVNIWDRYLAFFLNDFLESGDLWAEEAWSRVARFALFMKDEEAAKALIQTIEAARGMTTLASYMAKNQDILRTQLDEIRTKSATSIYPYTYCEARP